ncbi:MAG: hypothetical protein ABI600_00940 [Luteolibacter sp.]
MRILAILLAATTTLGHAHAQTLTDADREALLGNLEKLRESAISKVDGKYRVALAAFRSAMSSDDQALELYLNCYEKVNFEEQQKKTQDFREWKRKEADKLADPAFRKALRIQLSWLILTLQAAAEKPDMPKLTRDAEAIVDAIFLDATKLASQEQLLSQSVTASVFAKVYELNHVKTENWPGSPTALDQFYEKFVFPPLRDSSHLPALHAAWIKRIQQECAKREFWGPRETKKPGSGNPSTSDYEKFLAEGLPQLEWDMEVDLFNHGDESSAALRMLAIIEKNISHPSAREWGEQFKTLLQPKAPPAPPATTGAAP